MMPEATAQATKIEKLYAVLTHAAATARTLPNWVADVFRQQTAQMPATTEAERLVVQRVGQNLFHQALLDYWHGQCAVTDLAVPELCCGPRTSNPGPSAPATTSGWISFADHDGVLVFFKWYPNLSVSKPASSWASAANRLFRGGQRPPKIFEPPQAASVSQCGFLIQLTKQCLVNLSGGNGKIGCQKLLSVLSPQESSQLKVLAAPACGKTHTLIARLPHLITSGMPAAQILVLSFSNEAAREPRCRLDASALDPTSPLNQHDYSDIRIETTHAWTPLKESQQRKLLKAVLKSTCCSCAAINFTNAKA